MCARKYGNNNELLLVCVILCVVYSLLEQLCKDMILLLLCIIGFAHPSDGISTEDKITLCIVENYLDFKVKIYNTCTTVH